MNRGKVAPKVTKNPFYEELQLNLNQIECKRMIFHSPFRPQNIIFALKDIDKRIKPQNVTSKQ